MQNNTRCRGLANNHAEVFMLVERCRFLMMRRRVKT